MFRDLIIAGPAPAPLLKAEKFYRYQIMLRTRAMGALSRELARLIQSLVLPEDVTLTVDIDPVSLSCAASVPLAAQIIKLVLPAGSSSTHVEPSNLICATSRANSSSPTSRGMAWQVFSKPGKFQKFGKSRHCCGLTDCTEQSSPSRKMQLAFRFLLQRQAAPILPQAREMLDEIVFADALERGEPRDFFVRQTHLPGQRQQAVQR